jgi:hypothetical protein
VQGRSVGGRGLGLWKRLRIQSRESLGSRQGRRREDDSRRRPISLGARQVRAGEGHDRHGRPEQNLSAIYLIRRARVRSFSSVGRERRARRIVAWLGLARRHVSVRRDCYRGRGAQSFGFWEPERTSRSACDCERPKADSRAPTRSVVVCIVGRRPTGNEACEHRTQE